MSSGVLLSSCASLSLSSHTKLSSDWRSLILRGNADKMAEKLREQRVRQRGGQTYNVDLNNKTKQAELLHIERHAA